MLVDSSIRYWWVLASGNMQDGFVHASVPSVKKRVVNETLLAPLHV